MTQEFTYNEYTGAVLAGYSLDEILPQLTNISSLLSAEKIVKLSTGADYVVKSSMTLQSEKAEVAIKVFKPQFFWKDWYDRKNKSKAERSFNAAAYLVQHEIGTPKPIAFIDQWRKKRLINSYYICMFEPAKCFRDLVSDILWEERNSQPLMDLLLLLAPALRKMHDAGFMHGDMGNQNILIPQDENGIWHNPQWIDLNRCQIFDRSLTLEERAFDISRMILPSFYRKLFLYIYSNHQEVDKELLAHEEKYRTEFTRHRRNSKFRHPIRYLRRKKSRPLYPAAKDIWLWDEKTAQPMISMTKKDKSQYREWRFMLSAFTKTLTSLLPIWRNFHKVMDRSFKQPVELKNRIGIALHPHPDYLVHELNFHKKLNNPSVMIRFYHHETEQEWQRSIQLIESLHSNKVDIMIALIQDRRAVLNPESWTHFLKFVIAAIADKVNYIEITHAYNRSKWGVWNNRELMKLIKPAFQLQQQYPNIKLTGPACIDFEYIPVITALKSLPKRFRFSALSHLLYVDRRGAPENTQGKFSTLEKAALLKSVAETSSNCDNKVIISEVNWPIKNTGVWSPIICPYVTPKWKKLNPGETEDAYANFMLRYLAITICSGHIDKVYWWRLSAHGYGLVDDQDNFRERPAFKAFMFFLNLLGEARFERRLVSHDDDYFLEFSHNKTQYIMAWSTKPSKRENPFRKLDFEQAWNKCGDTLKVLALNESPIYIQLASLVPEKKS